MNNEMQGTASTRGRRKSLVDVGAHGRSQTDTRTREELIAAVDAAERRYSALLAVVPDLVLRLRRDGTYLEYRRPPMFPAFSSLDQVLGHTTREILPADVAEERMAAIELAFSTGREQAIKYELPAGGVRRLREERIAVSGPDEVVATVRDITEFREAKETLRQLEERLRSLFENVPDFIATLAPDGTVLFVNQTVAGIRREDVTGTTIYQYVPREQHGKVRAAVGRVLSTGQSSTFEMTTVGPRGSQRSFSCRVGAVTRDGEVVALTLVATDVTETERVLEALRESEERYRGLVEGSHDPIFITTRDGRVIDFNQAALDLFGYGKEELPRVDVSRLYANRADRDRFRAEIERTGSVRDYDVRLRRRDGTEFDGLLTASVRRSKEGTVVGYQGILRDVTRRKRLVRQMLEVSEREQRRIGRDLHDGLGQHLTGIAFLSKVLTQKLASKAAPEAGDATTIERLVNEAISQTRSLAKGLQPVALEKGGLAVALEEMCSSMTQLFGIPCHCRLTGELFLKDGSLATNLYHIAREAVNNAVKHSEARNVGIEVQTTGRVATLLVRDDGVGMGQTSDKGHGLGLHIMRYRASMIGGSLDVQSTPGGGTVVRCTVPIPGGRGKGKGDHRDRDRARQAHSAR